MCSFVSTQIKHFVDWSVWKLTRHCVVHGTFIVYYITHFLHILDILDYKIDMTDVTVNVSNKRRMTAIRNTSTNTCTITNTKYKGENWNFAVFITSCSSNRRPIQVRQPHRRPCKKVQESALLLWYQNKTGWKMKYSLFCVPDRKCDHTKDKSGQNRVLSAAHGAPIVEVLNQYLTRGTN